MEAAGLEIRREHQNESVLARICNLGQSLKEVPLSADGSRRITDPAEHQNQRAVARICNPGQSLKGAPLSADGSRRITDPAGASKRKRARLDL
jgi:hypothetical protein